MPSSKLGARFRPALSVRRVAGRRTCVLPVPESDDVLAGDDIFAAREFENGLVERGNSGEIERVETLHRGKAGSADAPLDHAPFAIGGKLELPQMMGEKTCGGAGLAGGAAIVMPPSRTREPYNRQPMSS
jgi:hypothetical protein